MASEDRLTALLEQTVKRVTGIDFVQVVDPADQTVLHVYFLLNPDELDDPIVSTGLLPVDVTTESVRIVSTSGGEQFAEVPVVRATYRQVSLDGEARTVLEVQTAHPGDFSIYRLTLIDEPKRRIDHFFNGVTFSFKQGCPSDLDCEPSEALCPPEDFVDFPVDYLARDFTSFRNALLDYAAQRYPQWTERIEADAGVMLAEIMAALGDELSYIQDRYAREAYLETAGQRRSLRLHTRLVDYHVHDGRSASTQLDLTVKQAVGGVFVPAGGRVWAPGQGIPPIPFELGEGLADTTADGGAPRTFWVHAAWNEMPVHIPDISRPCLPVGSTELFLLGHFPNVSQVPTGEDPLKFWLGKRLLIKSDPKDPSVPARRHMLPIVNLEHLTDPLFLDENGDPIAITRLRWDDAQALPYEVCLENAVVHGNLVEATAGETITEFFSIRGNANIPPNRTVAKAVERQGPLDAMTGRRSVTFLHSLARTESDGMGRLGEIPDTRPEIEVQEVNPADLQPLGTPQVWEWQHTLLDARGFDDAFTLDDGAWRRVIGFRRIGEVIEHRDYASGSGFTIRFGDGEFGKTPPDETVFRVRYRTGPGSRANLAADTVVYLRNPLDAAQADLAALLDGVTNPLPITNGVDPEDPEVVKQVAPEAFRAVTFRAVRSEDYAEMAERLPWVERANTRFRWTGSWLSTFVTPDPQGSFELSPERRTELENQMECVRQAGREVYVRNPRYVNVDLEITLCVEPSAYPGQVQERVLEALVGRKGVLPIKGFFDPDHFTFGTPLRRAALEAAIQEVPGVRGVVGMRIRARGITDWRDFNELIFPVQHDQVIRLQNDPLFPERGSVRILTGIEG
ncbi:hypothetical protein [Desulforhabdus sp. TSK]|uniref:hypothetical protein n=1 Tax=Desulforhabdus sp. TSK TaxID=2925014 RepID=UPI001FC82480|nr:hypothetical protein [Desulforhabdus sp. TSK]GKT07114.1 putative baseplate assembly protein [Desulforhabdus sp. TSK]